MIGYSAKIDVFNSDESIIDGATVNGERIGVLSNGEVHYTGSVSSDSNGIFMYTDPMSGGTVSYKKPYIIRVEGEAMRGLAITFDETNNEHPKNIYVNALKETVAQTEATPVQVGTTGNFDVSATITLNTDVLEIVSVHRSFASMAIGTPTPNVENVYISAVNRKKIVISETFTTPYAVAYGIVVRVLDSTIVPIAVKSANQIVTGAQPQNEIVLYIEDWNTPNKPLLISRIYCEDLSINIDRYNILSFNSETIDRKTMGKPSYGVISNSGTITVADTTREILDYHKNGLLKTGLPCKIFLNNTLTEKSEQIDEKHTKAWAYNELSAMVKISIGDDLMEWQDIQVASTVLQPEQNMLWVYNYLKEITPSRWQFEELDSNTTDYLSKIKLPYPYFDGGSLWSEWDKLAQACGLHIFKHNNKVIVKHDI